MKQFQFKKLLCILALFIVWCNILSMATPALASSLCSHCGGDGYCSKCNGLGDCEKCFGEGSFDCPQCVYGSCINCGGLGTISSYSISGIKERRCSSCSGSGTCRRCKGSGTISCTACHGSGDCSLCHGSGYCNYCGGSGYGRGSSSSSTTSSSAGSSTSQSAKRSSASSSAANGQNTSQHLELDRTSLTLRVGESYTFTVTGSTNDGKAYSVLDSDYLKEDTGNSFTYTALKPGKTTLEIRSTDNAVKAVCQITIEDDYFLGKRYIENSELDNLSYNQLRLYVNEIYARHGRKFNDPELQKYFDKQPWYSGTISPEDFDTSVFNRYEKKNAERIREYMNKIK